MNTAQLLQSSSSIVMNIGAYTIEGKSISEATRVGSVSLWDVVAPGLAIYSVPEILNGSRGGVAGLALKSFLRSTRNRYRELMSVKSAPESNVNSTGSVLFLAFEPRQAASFLPVADMLERRGHRVRVVTSRLRANEEDITGFSRVDFIEDFFDKEAFSRIGVQRAKSGRLIKRLIEQVNPAEIFTDVEAARRVLFSLSQKSNIENYFYEAVKNVELAILYLGRGNAEVVIGADDCDTRCRAFFLLASDKGVPTLHVQYGLVSEEAVNWKFMSTGCAALFGESSLNCLVEMGLDPALLRVTGQPRFDTLVVESEESRGNGQFGGTSNNVGGVVNILFASQPNVAGCFGSEEVRVKMLEEIYGVVKSIEGAVLTLRLHPDEDVRVHKRIVDKTGARVVIATSEPIAIDEAIKACDVLLTFHSTTALEALIADKPVILYGDGTNPIASKYLESGAVLSAKEPAELAARVAQVIDGGEGLQNLAESRRIFVNRYTKNHDGRSTERVAALVEELIGSGSIARGLVS